MSHTYCNNSVVYLIQTQQQQVLTSSHLDWNVNPDYYDYAVLKIDPISEDTPHVPIALTTDTQHGVNSKISVVGYFDDKPVKTKWLTTCEVSVTI